MNFRRLVQVVDTHTAGEPTRLITGGIPHVPGETMEAKRQWLAEHADGLRKFLLQEPRGHADMFGALLTAPATAEADLGLIFLDGDGYLRMCGHGTIGAAAAACALGWVDKQEMTFDTPAGLVHCRIHSGDGKARAVTFRNVPSFYLGEFTKDGMKIHIAYGGNLFALLGAEEVGLPLGPEALPKLVRLGLEVRDWANRRLRLNHPGTGEALEVELVEFYEEGDPPKNVVIFGQGQVDRSPCGTGTCAKMAFLHAHGRLGVGDEYRYQGILGTEFKGRIVAETRVGGRAAVIPEVTGAAFITGFGLLVLSEGDPFPEGFRLFPSGKGMDQ